MDWCAETCAAQVVAAAGYGNEGGVIEVGEKWSPGREFVGVIADYEGFGGKDAVVVRCSCVGRSRSLLIDNGGNK